MFDDEELSAERISLRRQSELVMKSRLVFLPPCKHRKTIVVDECYIVHGDSLYSTVFGSLFRANSISIQPGIESFRSFCRA